MTVVLRDVRPSDLDVFFEHQQDTDALHMAAFTQEDPADREHFDAHWAKLLANATVFVQAIDVEGRCVGHVARFEFDGDAEVTYWLARDVWNRGYATAALRGLLGQLTDSTVYARCAADHVASQRVLSKCGFRELRRERGFAHARGQEIDECVFAATLRDSS